MIRNEVMIDIAAPAELLFRYVADADRYVLWQGQVVSYAYEAAPAVGTRATSAVTFMGREMDVTGEITQWDPPKSAAWKSLQAPLPMSGALHIEPDGDRCRVTQSLEVHSGLGSLFGRVAEPVVVRMYRRQMEANLAMLKELAEAEAGTGPTT